MARSFSFALVVFSWAITSSEVLALGADHPKGPVTGNDKWPAGLKELANRPDRVHGYWVNAADVFFYDGDTKALNQFIENYAKLNGTTFKVVLHAGAKKARSPWDAADRNIPVAWSLTGSSWSIDARGRPKPGNQYETRVDIWLGTGVQLDELRIPAHIPVVSGGEIENFIAGRQEPQPQK